MSRFQAVERPQPGGRDPFRRTRNAHLHRSRRRRRVRRTVRTLVFMSLALGLAASAAIGGWRWMRATPVFAIDHIRVEGLQRSNPADLQARLLRVLETGTFKRLGGVEDIQVDVRVITATNRDLETMVADGTFRSDLYYRINVIPVELPPLRDRREEIPALAEFLLARAQGRGGEVLCVVS